MRVRYESFGGIISLDKPTATIYVDQRYMQRLGYTASHLWNTRASHLSAPLTVHFALTYHCPMACQTCYMGTSDILPQELSTSEAKRILDMLAYLQVFTVAFGGGEPLARSDVFELAEYARKRGLVPTLTTNGFYIDRKTAQHCRVFSHIHLSLDGINETYHAVRGVDGFEESVRALELLTEVGISLGINCIVCRTNFEHLEELVQFVLDYGVTDIIFLRLKPCGRAEPLYEGLRLTSDQYIRFYPYLRELTYRYGLKSHVDCAMMPFIYWHHSEKELLHQFAAEGCVAGNEIIEILPDGTVRACSFAKETVGKAMDLPRLWEKGLGFERFRRWMETTPIPCCSCEYLELCQGGCHVVAEALTGDLNAPDPECPFIVAGRT